MDQKYPRKKPFVNEGVRVNVRGIWSFDGQVSLGASKISNLGAQWKWGTKFCNTFLRSVTGTLMPVVIVRGYNCVQ